MLHLYICVIVLLISSYLPQIYGLHGSQIVYVVQIPLSILLTFQEQCVLVVLHIPDISHFFYTSKIFGE